MSPIENTDSRSAAGDDSGVSAFESLAEVDRDSVLPLLPVEFGSGLPDLLAAVGYREDEMLSLNTRRHDHHGLASRILRADDLSKVEVPTDRHVWIGLNPVGTGGKNPLPPGKRGGKRDVVRLRALVADLDIDWPGSKKPGLPDYESAWRVVLGVSDAMGWPPVAVIASGHGLQPIWRVVSTKASSSSTKHPLQLKEAADLAATFGKFIQVIAENVAPGVRLDGVANLDRIVRCPDSFNVKDSSDPRRVVVFTTDPETRDKKGRGNGRMLAYLAERFREQGTKIEDRPLLDVEVEGMALSEALLWVREQPGAMVGVNEMDTRLLDKFRPTELIEKMREPGSAHEFMLNRVYELLGLIAEGRVKGGGTALEFVEQAYRQVLSERSASEGRPDNVARRDFADCVRGGVPKILAKKRHEAELFQKSAWGMGRGTSTATERGEGGR